MPAARGNEVYTLLLLALLSMLPGCCAPCKRHVHALAAATVKRAPFDLVKDERRPEKERVDMNGIYCNPVWGEQAENFDPSKDLYPFVDPNKPEFACFDNHGAFTKPQCTTQETFCDLPAGWFHPAICALGGKCRIRGHMNWERGATYEGAVVWDQNAIDQDYDLFLYPPRQAGLTTASCTNRNKAFGIEFDSRETVGRLNTDDKDFWWANLRDAVDDGDQKLKEFVDQQVSKKFAIITGLLNLDCEHECTAELHPVWAMAIHTRDDPSDDRWAVLIRNWGNEGFCSSEQHYVDLPNHQFVLRIPWRNRASSVEVNTQDSKFWLSSPEVNSPVVTYVLNEAAYVKFSLPTPENQPLVLGELRLRWKDGQAEPVNPPGVIETNCEPAAAATPQERRPPAPSAEERLAQAKKLLRQDPEKLKLYNERQAARVQRPVVPGRFVQLGAAIAEPAALATPASPPTFRRDAPDPQKVKDDILEGVALCAAFSNNIPGLPGVCKSVRKH